MFPIGLNFFILALTILYHLIETSQNYLNDTLRSTWASEKLGEGVCSRRRSRGFARRAPAGGGQGRRRAAGPGGAADRREQSCRKVGQRFCAGCMTGDLGKLCLPRSGFDSVFNNSSYLWSSSVDGLDFLGNNNIVLSLIVSARDKDVSLRNIPMIER